MNQGKDSAAISKPRSGWLWRWAEPESELTVIPRSKTQRLAKQAKLANIDAERAINRAYQAEILRAKAVGEAMFKSGKALRCSIASSGRQILLRIEAAKRQVLKGTEKEK